MVDLVLVWESALVQIRLIPSVDWDLNLFHCFREKFGDSIIMLFKKYEEKVETVESFIAEFCFRRWCENAIWMISSKPTIEGKPFFPFLQCQNTRIRYVVLDSEGRCTVHNFCYLSLIQKWHSFELSKTPVLKRIYCFKHPIDEITSDKIKKIKHETFIIDSCIDSRKIWDTYKESFVLVGILKEAEHKPKFNTEKLVYCVSCKKLKLLTLMHGVFTAPQSTKGVPFYTGLFITKEMDSLKMRNVMHTL